MLTKRGRFSPASFESANSSISGAMPISSDLITNSAENLCHLGLIMTYESNQQHRSQVPGKSQWSIPFDDEETCFNMAQSNGWVHSHCAWGLHLLDNVLAYLGWAQDHETCVFVAKFVGNQVGNQVIWHGYPADHQNNQQDIPTQGILRIWLVNNVLKPAKIRRIMKGQRCPL